MLDKATEPRDIEKDKAFLSQWPETLELMEIPLYYITKYEALKQENAKLKAFYDYWCELYGQNLEVANWHQNGDTEPFDNFFNSAEELL